MKKLLLGGILSLFVFTGNAVAKTNPVAADSIVVKLPHIQLAATNSNAAEVFMDINNKSYSPVFLIAANSPVATQTQLQTTLHGRYMGQMRQIREIRIAAQESSILQVNGLHVMLMGLKQTLHTGDTIPLLLIFSDGSSTTIKATVD